MHHGLYRPTLPLAHETALYTTSLGSLIGTLSVADSRRIGLALALGVLRVCETPWLEKQWGRDDIVLFEEDGKVLADHPFVSADLRTASHPQIATHTSRQCFAPTALVGNETIFALGIVLIELCLEKRLEDLSAPADFNADGTKHVASDFFTATRVLDQVYDKAGTRYGDAVRRCIRCEFDQRKTTLDDAAFCRAVHDNVVAVLEEDVRQFFNL